jgi:glycosyltransferase involved in cell wall biosynthesis
VRLTYVNSGLRGGPARARNTGAQMALGDFLVFTDDDCVPDPGWLAGYSNVLAGGSDAVVLGGRTLNAAGVNLFAEASQNLLDFLYEWYNADETHARFFATNNLLCPAPGFRYLGGFDTSFERAAAEDRDFCDRWREHGRRLVCAKSAVVRHFHRSTLARFLKQHTGYGRGAVDLHRGRVVRGVELPRLEPLRFYWQLVTYAAGRGNGLRAIPLVMLAAASQVAYAWGYYTERARRRGARVAAPVTHRRPQTRRTPAPPPAVGAE